PKQLKTHGLKDEEIHISESVIRDIVRYYTREAGVRGLDREISKICRKVVKDLVTAQNKPGAKAVRKINITSKSLEKYLGVRRYDFGLAAAENQVGQVTGLAWTSV